MSLQPRYADAVATNLRRWRDSDPALWQAVSDAIRMICEAPTSRAARRDAIRTGQGNTAYRVLVMPAGLDLSVIWHEHDRCAVIDFVGEF